MAALTKQSKSSSSSQPASAAAAAAGVDAKKSYQAGLNTDEDTSTLLTIDDMSPRREVNEPAWLAFDIVLAYLVTYITHAAWTPQYRLAACAFITAFGRLAQYLYFNCGLDRPGSGEMPMDKWWHMALVHIGNTIFFWEFCVGFYDQIAAWRDAKIGVVLPLIYLAAGFYFVIWICDVIAGFVHWFGDTTEMYFFIYHHKDSRYMTRQSYVHHVWETFGLAIFLSYTVAPVLRTTLIGLSIRIIACQVCLDR